MREKIRNFFLKKDEDIEKGAKDMNNLAIRGNENNTTPWHMKIKVQDLLKFETPKGYMLRLYCRYEELSGTLSDEEAMKRAKDEIIYYNKDIEAKQEVESIKTKSVEEIEEKIGIKTYDENER